MLLKASAASTVMEMAEPVVAAAGAMTTNVVHSRRIDQ